MSGNLVRATVWAALWVLLFWISRANHPTAMLNAAATTLMVLASATAFVVMRTFRSTSAVTRVLSAALCIIGAGIVAALAIRAVYDVEVGPDPRRFGLAANIGMDSAVVAVLVVLMGAVDWNLRRFGFRSR